MHSGDVQALSIFFFATVAQVQITLFKVTEGKASDLILWLRFCG